jgi:hypothetical protein
LIRRPPPDADSSPPESRLEAAEDDVGAEVELVVHVVSVTSRNAVTAEFAKCVEDRGGKYLPMSAGNREERFLAAERLRRVFSRKRPKPRSRT